MKSDPLTRLAALSAQSRARTTVLEEQVGLLLAFLARREEDGGGGVLPNVAVTVDGLRLTRYEGDSNVGTYSGWRWRFTREKACDLDRPCGASGYHHGDFHAPWRGPERADLIAFAARAGRFVAAFATRVEAEGQALAAAIGQVQAALAAQDRAEGRAL